MLPKTNAETLYGQLTNNASSTNLSFGLSLMNEGQRMMLGAESWPFLEKQQSIATVASQQFYNLAGDIDKLISLTVTVGTTKYVPSQAKSFEEWDAINSTTGILSNAVSYFFVYNGTVGLWPIPSSSSNTITVNYQKAVRDVSIANYTTGTITSIANAASAVIGSGSTWTVPMAGRFIRFTYSDTANTGDGLWYEISSVGSATTLTLVRKYLGASIAAGTAAYTIGDCLVVPEKYQLGPVYYAVSEYWRKQDDNARADRFQAKYDELLQQMRGDESTKTIDRVISTDDENRPYINPNNAIWAT